MQNIPNNSVYVTSKMGRQKNNSFSKPLYFLNGSGCHTVSTVAVNLLRKPTLYYHADECLFSQSQNPYFSSLSHSFHLKREIEEFCYTFWARFYFYSSAGTLTSALLLTDSRVSGDSNIHLCALLLLKSLFPIFRAPSQFSLPLVAVETCTSPSSSIQNGSIPFSPDFPLQ